MTQLALQLDQGFLASVTGSGGMLLVKLEVVRPDGKGRRKFVFDLSRENNRVAYGRKIVAAMRLGMIATTSPLNR